MTTSGPPGVLLAAFHFPPFKGSSGLERTLGFVRHLRGRGWRVSVLSASPTAYPAVSAERVADIPPDVPVLRAPALDTKRHLSLGPLYPRVLAWPDRWSSWIPGAVAAGWWSCGRNAPDVIWSTYPIASAHVVGYWLQRLTGLPWVADFRDPMVEFDAASGVWYPHDAGERRARLKVEGLCARHAAALVFCTAGAARIFRERYPAVDAGRIHVVPNGFDEAAFGVGVAAGDPVEPGAGRCLTLVHSGILYPGPDRDPVAFMRALRGLLDESPWYRGHIKVILRASGFEQQYAGHVAELGLESVVELAPAIPYRDALREMLQADGLLLFQGPASNPAIPAKMYEYFRAGRPIFALVDSQGETAALLRSEGVGTMVPIDAPDAIRAGLRTFLAALLDGTARGMSRERAAAFDRAERARELEAILRGVTT